MSKTVAQIMSEAAVRLDDEGFRRFTEPTLRTWILEGERDIARLSECLRATSDIAVSANTQTVTGPTDLIRFTHAEFLPTGQSNVYPLEFMDRRSLDPIWGLSQSVNTSNSPSYFTTWGAPPTLSIMLYPTPSSAGTLRVYYYRLPADIATDGSDDTDLIDLPQGWEDLVTTYVEARGYRKDKRVEDYKVALTDYQTQLAALTMASQRFTDQPGQFNYSPDWPGAGFGYADVW